jgi:predicted enzyme related to lactoylglutathione lyase
VGNDGMKVNKILSRFYVHEMSEAVEFYEKVLNEKCSSRFKYTEMNLELAQVGNILLLCGSDEALKPFKDTKATFLVDSIIEYRDFLLKNGSVIIRDLKEVPTGRNMTLKHLDGTIVEYVEFKN